MGLKGKYWLWLLIIGFLNACGIGGNSMKAEQFFKPEMVTLLKHIQRGEEKEACAMIEKGLSLNIHGEEDITPLLWLITQKSKKAVKLALTLGADPNFEQADGGNAITFVAGAKDNEWLELLLAAGGDPNSVDHNEQPALFGAIGQNNRDAVELLLSYGADINALEKSRYNAVLEAAALNNFEMAYYLLERGGDYRHRSNTGADLAWNIHKKLSRNLIQPSSSGYEWMMKCKEFIEQRGVTFPPPSPKEIRTMWAKEGRLGYKVIGDEPEELPSLNDADAIMKHIRSKTIEQ